LHSNYDRNSRANADVRSSAKSRLAHFSCASLWDRPTGSGIAYIFFSVEFRTAGAVSGLLGDRSASAILALR
jgi:hypothetical protein